MFAALVHVAHHRELTHYQELAPLLGLPPQGFPLHVWTPLYELLGNISRHEVKQGRPMLSAVVIKKLARRPGWKFFRLASELGRMSEREDKEGFWRRELAQTYKTWERPKT